ncbi:MAG: leucine-rich repeat protein, partial [Thermoguttaceae bacterium]|nr:leucine-rich repeat protein [Thermoguttaceae bacterium]
MREGRILVSYKDIATSEDEHVSIPDCYTILGENCFRGHMKLKSIKIPTTITEIRRGAFCDCRSLRNIQMP